MKASLLDDAFANVLSAPQVSSEQLLTAAGLAVCLSVLMAYVYRRAARENYNPDIAQSMIMLGTLMALVMLVVGDTLSRAFGAVGILSVMRFRIKFKGPRDALTLLSAVVIGMACGVGMFRVAIAGSLLLCLMSLCLAYLFAPAPKSALQVDPEEV